MLTEFVEAAPAKVNLALHVVGRRTDGYHLLESLVVFAEVGDEVRLKRSDRPAFRVTGPFAPALSGDGTNLVERAVAAFEARWPGRLPGPFDIELQKNLPVASGLGGGSADAAATLRALCQFAARPPPVSELADLALTLGADVPVCLVSRPVEMRGIGEILHPLLSFPPLHIVLANPLKAVATADVFRALARRDNPPLPALPAPLDRPAQLALWLADTRNDLEDPAIALVPEIGTLVAELAEAEGAILSRMSGSGATVFGLFGSAGQAHEAAHDLRRHHPGYWVTAAPLRRG